LLRWLKILKYLLLNEKINDDLDVNVSMSLWDNREGLQKFGVQYHEVS